MYTLYIYILSICNDKTHSFTAYLAIIAKASNVLASISGPQAPSKQIN